MSCEVTLQDVTSQAYPTQYPFTASSRVEETDISEILDSTYFFQIRQKWLEGLLFYPSLFPQLEIDLSSVQPHFEIKSETSLIRETTEEAVPEEMLEYDVVVRIPPRKRYTIELRIKTVRRGEPRIVEPEGLQIRG